MALEVERKFLVEELPEALREKRPVAIAQGYLAICDHTEVRIRRAGENHLLTVKRGSGEVREEVELAISAEQFERLWPVTQESRVHKERFLLPLGELTAEVDVFHDALEGLVVAEIEFPSEPLSSGFQPPEWLGREVTGDPRYANQSLARSGPPTADRGD